jgi:hypothetical protein
MDKTYHIGLMVTAIQNYLKGTVTLGGLLHEIEEITDIVDEELFKDLIFDEFVDLHEIYAYTAIGNFDFDRRGRHVVDQALVSILDKLKLQHG